MICIHVCANFWIQKCIFSAYPGEDLLFDNGIQLLQLFGSGIPAYGYPEGAVNGFGGHLHGFQNMASVTFCAGGTGGDADAVILQDVDGVLGGHTGDADVQDVGGGMGTVQMNAGQGGQFGSQMIQQFPLFFDILFKRSGTCCAGGGKDPR